MTKMISQLGSSVMAVPPMRRMVQPRERAARAPRPRRGETSPGGDGELVPSGEPRRDDERRHQQDHGDHRDDGPDAGHREPAAHAAPGTARRARLHANVNTNALTRARPTPRRPRRPASRPAPPSTAHVRTSRRAITGQAPAADAPARLRPFLAAGAPTCREVRALMSCQALAARRSSSAMASANEYTSTRTPCSRRYSTIGT